MRIAAILVAAGSGSRFGGPLAKQFTIIGGKPVLRWAADALLPHVSLLQPVGNAAAIGTVLDGLVHLPVVPGGATRQDSVRAGLEALVPHAPDVVLVHDGARPYVPAGTVPALLAALKDFRGAIPAVAVADTLKRGNGGKIAGTVSRAGLFRAQTPQAFDFATLLAAHRQPADPAATDDAWLLEQAGHEVALVDGHEENVKLTIASDAARLERILSAPMIPRVGTGFDVHVTKAGRPMILCGVTVPCEFGLDGHSDADVGIHALCDAIYGALAEGDIGRHFPPTEGEWKDADSARFLRHAAERIAARGRRAGERGCDADLRAAEDHAACAGDARAAGGAAGRGDRGDFREGDDNRAAGVYGTWRRGGGAGGGVRAGAGGLSGCVAA